MSNLSYSELRKCTQGVHRANIFVKKLKDKTPFELKNGKKIVAVMQRGVDKTLLKGTKAEIEKLVFTDEKGTTFKLSDVVKNKEFGGKGAGSGTLKEDAALLSLRSQIYAAKKSTGKAVIPIKIGNVTHQVYDVVSTPGVPKSDFHLVDINGVELAWISHKDGTTAKHFQQWGGISKMVEPAIFAHAETQQFIADVVGIYRDGMPSARTIARKIKARSIQTMSVYGNQFPTKIHSRQNVSLMLQGEITLKKSGKLFIIDAHHSHLNGEIMTGGYAPVFMLVYKGDRSDLGIKGARASIAPLDSRKITAFI